MTSVTDLGATLANVLSDLGPDWLESRAKLLATLRETVPGETRAIHVLMAAFDAGVPGRLASADGPASDFELGQETAQVVDNFGSSPDHARAAVETWASALGRMAGTAASAPDALPVSAEPAPVPPPTNAGSLQPLPAAPAVAVQPLPAAVQPLPSPVQPLPLPGSRPSVQPLPGAAPPGRAASTGSGRDAAGSLRQLGMDPRRAGHRARRGRPLVDRIAHRGAPRAGSGTPRRTVPSAARDARRAAAPDRVDRADGRGLRHRDAGESAGLPGEADRRGPEHDPVHLRAAPGRRDLHLPGGGRVHGHEPGRDRSRQGVQIGAGGQHGAIEGEPRDAEQRLCRLHHGGPVREQPDRRTADLCLGPGGKNGDAFDIRNGGGTFCAFGVTASGVCDGDRRLGCGDLTP